MACSCSPINWRERVAQVLLAVAVGVISTLFPCDRMAVLGEFNVCVNKLPTCTAHRSHSRWSLRHQDQPLPCRLKQDQGSPTVFDNMLTTCDV